MNNTEIIWCRQVKNKERKRKEGKALAARPAFVTIKSYPS
jgi:hypothetical protein